MMRYDQETWNFAENREQSMDMNFSTPFTRFIASMGDPANRWLDCNDEYNKDATAIRKRGNLNE